METLAIIALVGNIVQFVDFSGKLIAKSAELYQSSKGALSENIDIETATKHLMLLNDKLQHTATTVSDQALERLCASCSSAADELLIALEKSRLRSGHTDHLQNLDSATQRILDAIFKQQDVFKAEYHRQSAFIGTLHSEMILRVKDENVITRREIIQEIRQREQDTCLAGPRKSCQSIPLLRNRHFVGRSVQLEQLEARLFGENHFPRVAVTGLGGVGKIQIVLELAYRTRDQQPEYSVFWLSSTSAQSIQQGFLGIAQQLRVPGLEDKKEDVKELVKHYLSQESAGNWLLVVDNADDLDMWFRTTDSSTEPTRLIDTLPKSSKGSTVFTALSRKTATKFASTNLIHVAEMDEETTAQVLGNSLVNKDVLTDNAATVQLLGLLSFLPLAIVQAAAYINANDISLAEYISLFQDCEETTIEVLSEDFEDEGRYPDIKNPIAATWLISFEQIQACNSLATDYLSFISCIDPKGVPLSLLPPAPTRKKGIDAIGTLSAYSFIIKRPADQSFDVHRLVHLTTRNWLRKQKLLSEWTVRTIDRLAEVFPNNDHHNRALWRSYLPHMHYVKASNVFQENIEKYLPCILRFGLCLFSDGQWKEAEIEFVKVTETRKRVLREEHPDTLTGMANLASTFWNQGRWKESEELDMQVIETRQRVLGEEHPDTLTSIANLASTFSDQGRWKEAEELEMQVMETRQRVLGEDHLDTLNSMANLASTYSDQGQWKKAEVLEVHVMKTGQRVLREQHPSTLTSMANLASTFWNQGRWKEAEELEVQVMETRQRVLGEKHPDTLTSVANLAFTLKSQSRDEEAISHIQKAFMLQKQILGPHHPYTEDSLRVLQEWQMESKMTEL